MWLGGVKQLGVGAQWLFSAVALYVSTSQLRIGVAHVIWVADFMKSYFAQNQP